MTQFEAPAGRSPEPEPTARALEAGGVAARQIECGRVGVSHLALNDAVELVLGWVLENRVSAPLGRGVHLVNAWTVVLAERDQRLAEALMPPAINLPDGTPIVWNARLRSHHVPRERVRGPQFFLDVLDRGREFDVSHYFLGSTPETLARLNAKVSSRLPGVRIAGFDSPPFRPLSEEELSSQDSRIIASGAEIIWVGLGTPKQDLETERLASSIPAIAAAVGAAFDFTAGTIATAPAWMRDHGLEWVHRLVSEPRRLWRRYLIGNAQFIRIATRKPVP